MTRPLPGARTVPLPALPAGAGPSGLARSVAGLALVLVLSLAGPGPVPGAGLPGGARAAPSVAGAPSPSPLAAGATARRQLSADTGAAGVAGDTLRGGAPGAGGMPDTIRGRVVGPGGEVLAGAPVLVLGISSRGDTLWQALADADSAGAYLLGGLREAGPAPAALAVRVTGRELAPFERRLDAGSLGEVPSLRLDVVMEHRPYSYGLALLVVLPALVGLLIAIVHTAGYARTKERAITFAYALGSAVIWCVVVGYLGWEYAVRGVERIRFFSDAVEISVLVPIAAFLGVLVYATYHIAENHAVFYGSAGPDEVARRKILLAIANRILAAPYLAIVLVLVLFDEATGPLPTFMAFFTGLWIKVVFNALNELGKKLLTEGAQRALAENRQARRKQEARMQERIAGDG